MLDFQKVSQKERLAAKKLFESAQGGAIIKDMHKDVTPTQKKSGLVGQKRTQKEDGGAGAAVEEEKAKLIAELDAKIAGAESLEEV